MTPSIAQAIKKGVPGIPLAALDSIEDPNIQQVLRAIVDGWHVRNGSSGDGKARFVTATELGDLSGVIGGLRQSVAQIEQGRQSLNAAQISRIITDLQASVMESVLFKELGDRIRLIDLSVVAEQQARIDAVQQVADDLAAEAATRLGFDNVHGSAINSLQSITDTQATQISGLTTRVVGAESTIVNLQNTTATQATQLNSLTTRVGTAESNITSLQTTTATQATSLSSLTTRVGSAESNISTLNTTTANQANSLTALTTRVGTAESAITSEATTRANADNAITTSVNTQFATVNGNISALQTSQTTTANNVAALSSTVTTLQATVGSNTTAIQTEATARVNADNDIYSKYSVKIDTNGYVSGFGLISTANNSTPYSEFIIRADRFSIASPSGPGISPQVPFVVLTTTDSKGNAPGVYVDNAIIKNAAVGTLKLDGEAVTIPRFAEQVVTGQNLTTSWSGDVCSVNYTVSGLGGAETARVVVIAVMQAYPTNNTITDLILGIFANGTLNTSVASTYSENGISMANVGSWFVGNGTYTASIKVACFATGPGASSKSNNNLVSRLIVLTAKR
jgi:predicted  nucleic acid-binding Zn-ribbon protein